MKLKRKLANKLLQFANDKLACPHADEIEIIDEDDGDFFRVLMGGSSRRTYRPLKYKCETCAQEVRISDLPEDHPFVEKYIAAQDMWRRMSLVTLRKARRILDDSMWSFREEGTPYVFKYVEAFKIIEAQLETGEVEVPAQGVEPEFAKLIESSLRNAEHLYALLDAEITSIRERRNTAYPARDGNARTRILLSIAAKIIKEDETK